MAGWPQFPKILGGRRQFICLRKWRISISNRELEFARFRAKSSPRRGWGVWGGKLMRKMWNPNPLFVREIRPRQTVADCPKFPKILGEPWVIRWSPKMALFVSNSGPRQVRGRTTKALHIWGIPVAIKVRNMASRDSGRLSAIPRNFWRISGNLSVSKNGHFLVASRD